MIILGIDPGYERLGWGVIRKEKSIEYLDCGVIQTAKENSPASRLAEVYSKLSAVITMYSPDVAAVESIFFFKNQKTVIEVAQARGVILACLARSSVKTQEFTPLQIKAIVAGNGQADKKGVEKMVRLQLPAVPKNLLDDTLDAMAAALAIAYETTYG